MPSVRVRRRAPSYSQYAFLREDNLNAEPLSSTQGRPRAQTISNFFSFHPQTQPGPSDSDPERQSQRRASDHSTATAAHAYTKPISKVAHSILNAAAQTLPGHSRGPTAEPLNREGMTLLHGSQLDVAVHNEDLAGAIGSSLSLASHISSVSPFDDSHHEDDIVEHLDVIDPRIATISSMANAANAILIPPIGIYSRKPVVVLPRGQLRRDEETGAPVDDEDELDRHVEDCLSRRQKFKRVMQGVWAFLKTPMGWVVGAYGFLVVFWGTAILLFLIKWINLHNSVQQGFWLEVSQQIETALFTITGVGLIPWRAVDTYRAIRIWHYKRLTRRLRKKAGLPALYDEDDLPDPMYDPNHVHVLNEKQQHDLHYQQEQFMKSQTWYRAHGTPTHRAFPINTALWICLFNDGNSFFQCFLCGIMWGLNRFDRPAWATGLLIGLTFVCGFVSAGLIWRGGQKTKRTREVEERLRKALALEHSGGAGKGLRVRTNASGAVVNAPPSLPAPTNLDAEEKGGRPQKINEDGDAIPEKSRTSNGRRIPSIFFPKHLQAHAPEQ